MCAVFAQDGKIKVGVIAFVDVLFGSLRWRTQLREPNHDFPPACWILALHDLLSFRHGSPLNTFSVVGFPLFHSQ